MTSTNSPISISLTVPDGDYWSMPTASTDLTMHAYKSGYRLSYYSGSTLSNFSGKTLDYIGVSGSYSGKYYGFDLTLNENTYFMTGYDVQYDMTLYNYLAEKIIAYYSGSSITNVESLTLKEFVFK